MIDEWWVMNDEEYECQRDPIATENADCRQSTHTHFHCYKAVIHGFRSPNHTLWSWLLTTRAYRYSYGYWLPHTILWLQLGIETWETAPLASAMMQQSRYSYDATVTWCPMSAYQFHQIQDFFLAVTCPLPKNLLPATRYHPLIPSRQCSSTLFNMKRAS